MIFQKKYKALQDEVIANLCSIKDFPKGLLPHTVYVEEENEGEPIYNKYKLHKINEDGTCSLVNFRTGEFEDRDLNEIELPWLITVWGRYVELKAAENPSQPLIQSKQKEKFIFVFPCSRFDSKNVSDESIVNDFEKGHSHEPVEKYTLEEFASAFNGTSICDINNFIKIIELEA